MPESVTDRPTKAHEQVFLLAKSASYYYDAEAIAEQEGVPQSFSTPYKHAGRGTGRAASGNEKPGMPAIVYNTRNKRSVWTLGPESYSGSHYAVMPTKLAEPCILAGSSQYGCCEKCLSPYERVVEHIGGDTEAMQRPKQTSGMHTKTSTLSLSGNGSKEWAERSGKTITTGWAATCHCSAAIVPATVLDPFFGSGTVLAVALKFGRRAIGIDLDERNLALARQRIEETQPRLLLEE
jgi:hypothetical protein